jgi:hypothetical protein
VVVTEPKSGHGNGDHSTALWAGLTALFSNLAAINVLALLDNTDSPAPGAQATAALITSFLVAGTVYTKQRLQDAKELKEQLARRKLNGDTT